MPSTTAPSTMPPAAPSCWNWRARGQRCRRSPGASALFLAVTAEEGGLRGSEYYATHPLIPPAKTAIDLNYDALYPLGPRQGRGDHRRGTHHGMPAGAADRAAPEPGRFRPTPSPSRATISAPTISPSRTRASRPSRSATPPSSPESRPATAQRCARSITASTTTSPRTNSMPIGISPRCAGGGIRIPARPGHRQPGQAARLAARRPVPPVNGPAPRP